MLTEKIIRDAVPTGKSFTVWDTKLKGLGLQVTRGGTKNYVLRYKAGDRWRQAIIARCAEISLKSARHRAAAELVEVRAGEKGPLERRREAREAPTVAEGLSRFFDQHCPARIEIGRMRPKTARDYRCQADKYVLPALGDRKVNDVNREDIESLLRPLAGALRNRVRALVSKAFGLFEDWGWRPQDTNPCRGVDRAREEPRDRVLSSAELQGLARALDAVVERHPGPVAAIRVTAVTGLRINEVLGIRWDQLDLEGGCVTLPLTKTGPRRHDLPTVAVEVIRRQPRINDWVFTTGRGALGYSHTRKVFAEAAAAAGLSDVRLHDLRRTVMTEAAKVGVNAHVLRDLLGHKTAAMADRYIKLLGRPVRDARERVGAEIAAMMMGAEPEQALSRDASEADTPIRPTAGD